MAQSTGDAVAYLNVMGKQYDNIREDTWDYMTTAAHSRRARKIENRRADLLKTIDKAITVVKSMSAFDNDYSLRDSVASYLTLTFNVVNKDYAKIVDMEAVAEQSYDLMEAYLMAQEQAENKLDMAGGRIDTQYMNFAAKYKVKLVQSTDELGRKLKRSSEAMQYYNRIFLVFFKANKQEAYLMDAWNKKDINALEQNRNALSSLSDEGLKKLTEIGPHKGDNSINMACRKMLTFYKDEADKKIPQVIDFMVASKEFEDMSALFKSKDKNALSSDDINNYNKALDTYNKSVNKFNLLNNTLNNTRSMNFNTWTNTVTAYINRYVPKK